MLNQRAPHNIGFGPITYVGFTTATNGILNYATLAGGIDTQPRKHDLIIRSSVRTLSSAPGVPTGYTALIQPYFSNGVGPTFNRGMYFKLAVDDNETDPLNENGRHRVWVFRNAYPVIDDDNVLTTTTAGTTGSVPAISTAIAGALRWGSMAIREAQSAGWTSGYLPGGATLLGTEITGSPTTAMFTSTADFTQRNATIASSVWWGASGILRRLELGDL